MTIEQGIELPPTSRFKVSDNPNVAPGYCCVCNSPGGDGRQFVDFGMQLDVYGAVYFCTYCVTELAVAAGFVGKDAYTRLANDNGLLKAELNATDTSFRDYRDATRILLRDCRCSDTASGSDAVDSKPRIPKPRKSESGTAEDDSESD